ncbi:hypothetical protein PQC39_gp032 [Vibrio phage Vp_R1]|uniref:Uncharacterized protein n=1 Tax=Vibrio phage Vp_R1 TaxID=2059867 RepID=A0A2H5BQH4_9CAUD|nr:hypothetical protein PQC39_gp032 [Vibrio phage Vp_R1]AUG88396.1 hypothetical protein VPR_032 [Vibrio phage Vp_R1]
MLVEIPSELGFAVLKEFEDGTPIEKGVVYLLRESLGMNPMEGFFDEENNSKEDNPSV